MLLLAVMLTGGWSQKATNIRQQDALEGPGFSTITNPTEDLLQRICQSEVGVCRFGCMVCASVPVWEPSLQGRFTKPAD